MRDADTGKKKSSLLLRNFLDQVVASTSAEERLANDPIGVVREFEDPADRETVALIASCLAYGRVDVLRGAIRRAIAPLGNAPATALEHTDAAIWPDALDGFVYRMTRGADMADLFAAIGSVRREFGSIEGAYASTDGDHLERAAAFVEILLARRLRDEVARGFRYLLPSPADGSTTKRLHMFFRWVVRGPDDVDLGLWKAARPVDLVMPLDTHTSRIARYIGLTQRASTDLKTALEVTNALRDLREDDPLAYDFAIAHLGISGRCVHRRSDEHCPTCPLDGVCQLQAG